MKVTNEQVAKLIEQYLQTARKCQTVFDRSWEDMLVHKLRRENYEGYSQPASQRWKDTVGNIMAELQQCSTFEELYKRICSINVYGIGELTKYDTATCIGCPLKIYPEYVYLHAGAKIGAVAIGIIGAKVEKRIFVEKFPAFEILEPIQIEDFLCIYKDQLDGKIDSIARSCR